MSKSKPDLWQARLEIQNRGILRLLGVDPNGLSAAEVAEGAEAARRISQCGMTPGVDGRRPQAIADWKKFIQRVRGETR